MQGAIYNAKSNTQLGFLFAIYGKASGGYLKLVLSSIRVIRELYRKQFCNYFWFFTILSG